MTRDRFVDASGEMAGDPAREALNAGPEGIAFRHAPLTGGED